MNDLSERRLRLWPAWLTCVAMMVPLVVSVTPSIPNGPRFIAMVSGPVLAALLFLLWVAVGSRLGWREKLGLAAFAILIPALSLLTAFPNDATPSAMFVYGLPLTILLLTIGLTLWASHRRRTLAAIGLMTVGWVIFSLFRNDGFDGDYYPEFAWRWSPIHEQTLPTLDARADQPTATDVTTSVSWDGGKSWPMFRGISGNGIVDDQFDHVDWRASPPKELWRIDIGPGWGSFSYHQGKLFTQEQRGEMEYVTAYWAEDGSLAWSHSDPSRFEEIVSGAGPRATPTVADGRVYAMGARALLNCLDESTGQLVWQRNLHDELKAPIPQWAFSGSPLVAGDLLVCYVGSAGDNGLIAVNRGTGETVWGFPSTGENYTTARLLNICGVECLVFCDGEGVHGLDAVSGSVLWTYKPTAWRGAPYIDPQMLGDNRLLVAVGDGVGLASLEASHDDGVWNFKEEWTSTRLRPSFNDSLVADNMIFGFSQNIFGCIDAQTGKRLWHGGRFGFGQALLLKNSHTIVMASEKGDLVLLRANGDKLDVVHQQPLLDDKTWNHPIVVGNRLFLRNGKTAVCLELAPEQS